MRRTLYAIVLIVGYVYLFSLMTCLIERIILTIIFVLIFLLNISIRRNAVKRLEKQFMKWQKEHDKDPE